MTMELSARFNNDMEYQQQSHYDEVQLLNDQMNELQNRNEELVDLIRILDEKMAKFEQYILINVEDGEQQLHKLIHTSVNQTQEDPTGSVVEGSHLSSMSVRVSLMTDNKNSKQSINVYDQLKEIDQRIQSRKEMIKSKQTQKKLTELSINNNKPLVQQAPKFDKKFQIRQDFLDDIKHNTGKLDLDSIQKLELNCDLDMTQETPEAVNDKGFQIYKPKPKDTKEQQVSIKAELKNKDQIDDVPKSLVNAKDDKRKL